MGLSVRYALVVVVDPLGHHATTCKRRGDAIFRHNNILAESFHTAHLSEAGAGLSTDLSQSRPADILVQDWDRGKPVAFEISVVSPLNSNGSGSKSRCSIRGGRA